MITKKSRFEPESERRKHQRYPSVKRSFLDLTKDAVVLAELQVKLAKQEAQQGFRGLVMPVVAIIIAIILGLGTAPVLLLLIGESFVELAGFGRPAAYAIATGIGLLVVAVIGIGGWMLLRQRLSMFDRSVTELKQNIAWFKSVIGSEDPTPENHS